LCIPLECQFLPPYPSLLEARRANEPPSPKGSAPKGSGPWKSKDSPLLPVCKRHVNPKGEHVIACRRAIGSCRQWMKQVR
jgi:hypothetical protein